MLVKVYPVGVTACYINIHAIARIDISSSAAQIFLMGDLSDTGAIVLSMAEWKRVQAQIAPEIQILNFSESEA